MKNWKSLLALVMALVMAFGILAGCDTAAPPEDTKPGSTATGTQKPDNPSTAAPSTDVYQMKGSVTIAYPEAEIAEIQPVLEAFRAQYPNIEVVEEPFPGSTGGAFNEYLTQKAAANSMPDLMWLDWNDFAPEVASGFVMPLDDYFFADPESEYVPSGMTDPYVYGGKLYALPCQMNAMGITMNLDMLEALNIEKPGYDWTVDEFIDICKKAITADTCAAATLEDWDQVYSAQADGLFYPAYDFVNQSFDFTNKWVPAMNQLAELRAIPGFPMALEGTAAQLHKIGDKDSRHLFWVENNTVLKVLDLSSMTTIEKTFRSPILVAPAKSTSKDDAIWAVTAEGAVAIAIDYACSCQLADAVICPMAGRNVAEWVSCISRSGYTKSHCHCEY